MAAKGLTTESSGKQPSGSFESEALPHLDAVYRFALRLSGAGDTAEDLVQETFLRAFRSWDQYTLGTSAKSWLFTICRNVFLRQRERSKRHDEILTEKATEGVVGQISRENPVFAASRDDDPEGDFFRGLVDDRILQAIQGLQEEYRMAVILSDVEGLSYQDVSEVLQVPVGTVKSRLFRGRRALQKVLFDYAVEEGYLSGDRVASRG